MAEYGFAVEVDELILNYMAMVRKVLRKNYEQYVKQVEEQGGDTSWTECPVYLVKMPSGPGTSAKEMEAFAWYVNTEPDQIPKYFEVLETLEAVS
jgi:hypothetical protein